MTIKNEVLVRVYVVLVLVVLVAVVIFAKAFEIAILDGKDWREKGDELYRRYVPVEAERGNVLTEDGSLLATSLPFFDIAFDPNSSGMKATDWENNIDSLSYCLATFIDPTYTPGGYKWFLEKKRADSSQYVVIKKNASLAEMELMKSFPLFNLGQHKGGFIAKKKYSRRNPFNWLASRSIGYVRDTIQIGLEGYFNEVLAGEEGRQLMYRVDRLKPVWMPVDDLAKIEPINGKDLVTTIDVNIQDITENALNRAMNRHQAKYGVAIIMEVETGAIRAIANLEKWENGNYAEVYNNAIAAATEPGSTYKLPAIMALLEDGYVSLDDSIDIEMGTKEFYEEVMQDAMYHQLDTTTVKHAFEISSNVGIAKLVTEHYGKRGRAEKFIKRLHQFHLDVPTGIEIKGEITPYVKSPDNPKDNWSGTTLPWMSIGYEVTITPLQLLTFYNAVANDGKMMKPYMVTEIQEFGETVEKFPAIQIKNRIASKNTIAKAKELLEAVVENGTASKFKSDKYRFAGKTGTAQLDYKKLKDKTIVGGHQASFAGYFPAEKPKYSCIILISDPKEGGIYGSQVALPVFREIADKIVATKVELFPALNKKRKPQLTKRQLPDLNAGHRQDIQTILSYLELPFVNTTPEEWTVIRATETDSLKLQRRTTYKDQNKVPSVIGMGLRDALYLLENLGLSVETEGFGKIKEQSIRPGTRVNGQKIRLKLG